MGQPSVALFENWNRAITFAVFGMPAGHYVTHHKHKSQLQTAFLSFHRGHKPDLPCDCSLAFSKQQQCSNRRLCTVICTISLDLDQVCP